MSSKSRAGPGPRLAIADPMADCRRNYATRRRIPARADGISTIRPLPRQRDVRDFAFADLHLRADEMRSIRQCSSKNIENFVFSFGQSANASATRPAGNRPIPIRAGRDAPPGGPVVAPASALGSAMPAGGRIAGDFDEHRRPVPAPVAPDGASRCDTSACQHAPDKESGRDHLFMKLLP